MQRLLTGIATLGFIGYLPVAPGTWAALTAALFFFLLKPGDGAALALLGVTCIIGTFASHEAEKVFNEKDSGKIVIDELAGYIVSVLFLPPTLMYYGAAFLLFRFFDILKPPPISTLEKRLSGGIGIMADDIVAGVVSNILLQGWRVFTGL